MPSSSAFLSFEPAPGPGDDQIGLGADRARRPRAEPLGLGLGLVAAHGLEAAGEDDGLAGPSVSRRVADERLRARPPQQIVEHLAVVRLVEEIDQRLGDHRADALDRRQFGLRRRPTSPLAAAPRSCRSICSRSLAVTMPTWRMPSPNRKRAGSGSRLASIAANRLSTDFSSQPSRPSRSSRCCAGGRCRRATAASQFDELDDRLLAQPLDVERAARRRNAAAARTAAPGRSGRRCSGRRPRPPRRPPRCRIRGNGRGRRKAARCSSRVRFSTTCGMTSPARWMRTRSPIAQAEPGDLVAVVQRDVGDDDAADADRLQPPDRASACRCGRPGCRSPRASSRPSRPGICAPAPSAAPARPGRAAPASRAGRPCRRRRRYRTAGRRAPARSRDNGRASRPASSQRTSKSLTGMPQPSIRFIAIELRLGQRLADLAPAMGEEAQRPRRGDRRILLPQRAGGGVARVGEDLAARSLPAARSRRRSRPSTYRLRRAPRTRRARPARRCGMSAMVRTLAVTSSPTVPSPRVAARTSSPFS